RVNGLVGAGTEPAAALTAQTCTDSDDDGLRIAGRYIHSWGNGHTTMLAAMYEELSWDLDCGAVPDTVFDDLEIDHWMISGKHNFPGPLDFRFSYMDADEYECGSASLASGSCVETDSDATAFNVGIFYTMPAGTELRLVYSEVDNESNATYDFGINGAGGAAGTDKEAIGIGMVQWF
ncbi:MAG: hypothetical protein O6852_06795, partial [Gammaproteobacteria bacterium]|nr:hypothetical protein [Gammaproteobacteria bacterium]